MIDDKQRAAQGLDLEAKRYARVRARLLSQDYRVFKRQGHWLVCRWALSRTFSDLDSLERFAEEAGARVARRVR